MPTTEAGRALLDSLPLITAKRILAIEQEAVTRVLDALVCEDPEEPCDADGRDEHRWCDNCIARHAIQQHRPKGGPG